jgi:hypothetical protein
MFKIHCYKCTKELKQQGALLLGPPVGCMGEAICEKKHFCHDCYDRIMQWIREDIVTSKPDITLTETQSTIA